MRGRRRVWITRAGLALALASIAAAPTRAQEGVFGEVIDVRVVNLEVVVTEDGQRVTGLKPEDFLLTVDGREVPIEYFTEVHGGTAVLRGTETAGSAVPALAPGVAVGTSYLLFIDEYFSLPTDRNRVLRRIIDQLPFLAPEDRMAVVAFNGKKVEMLSTWSQSVTALERVLEKALDRRAYGLSRRAEQRLFESTRDLRDDTLDGVAIDDVSLADDLEIDERVRAEEITTQVKRAVLAASSALRSFANPPGRKVMLLLAGGWPYNPAQWVVRDAARMFYADTVARGTEIYRQLIETANRLSYTLYPVDVPGIDTSSLADVELSGRGEAALNRIGFVEREREEEQTLHTLARETGGRAFVDGAAADAFQRVFEDTRSYYWIGFTPSWKGDDALHKVRIESRRKGLKVRARGGFSDLSRETEVTMMVESALLFGDPPGAAPLGAAIGEGARAGRGKVTVALKVIIPLDGLTFLPAEGGFVADTELRVAVLDEDGNTSDIPVIPLGLKVKELPEPGRVTVYETRMKVRTKKHDLVVSIYDKPSGKILSTKVAIEPEAEKR